MCRCKRISLESCTNYLVVYMSTPNNLDSQQSIPVKLNKGTYFLLSSWVYLIYGMDYGMADGMADGMD